MIFLFLMGCVSQPIAGCFNDSNGHYVLRLNVSDDLRLFDTCSVLASDHGVPIEWECSGDAGVLYVKRAGGMFEIYNDNAFTEYNTTVPACAGHSIIVRCHEPNCIGLFCGSGDLLRQIINPLYLLGKDNPTVVNLHHAICLFIPKDSRSLVYLKNYGMKQEASRLGLANSFEDYDYLSYYLPRSDRYWEFLMYGKGNRTDRFVNYYLPEIGQDASFYGSQIAAKPLASAAVDLPTRDFKLFYSRVEPCLVEDQQVFCFKPFSRDHYMAVYNLLWPFQLPMGGSTKNNYYSSGWFSGFVFHPYLHDRDHGHTQSWISDSEGVGYSYTLKCLNCSAPTSIPYPFYNFGDQYTPLHHGWEGDSSPLSGLGAAKLVDDNRYIYDIAYADILYPMVASFGQEVNGIDEAYAFLKDHLGVSQNVRIAEDEDLLKKVLTPQFPFECESDVDCASLKCDKDLYWRGIADRTTRVRIGHQEYSKDIPINIDCRRVGEQFVCRYIPLSLWLKDDSWRQWAQNREHWPKIYEYHNRGSGSDDWEVLGYSTSKEFPLIQLPKDKIDDAHMFDRGGFNYDYYWFFPAGYKVDADGNLVEVYHSPLLDVCGCTDIHYYRAAKDEHMAQDFDNDAWNDPNDLNLDNYPLEILPFQDENIQCTVDGSHLSCTGAATRVNWMDTGLWQFFSVDEGHEGPWESGWSYAVWSVVGTNDPDMLCKCNMSKVRSFGICKPRPIASLARQDIHLIPTTVDVSIKERQGNNCPPGRRCFPQYNTVKYNWLQPGPCDRAVQDPLPLGGSLSLTNNAWRYSYPGLGGDDESMLFLLRPFVPLKRTLCYDKPLSFDAQPSPAYLRKKIINYLKANVMPLVVIKHMDCAQTEEGFNATIEHMVAYMDEGPVLVVFSPDFYDCPSQPRLSDRALSYALRITSRGQHLVLTGVYLNVSNQAELDRAKQFATSTLNTAEYPVSVVLLDLFFPLSGDQNPDYDAFEDVHDEEGFAKAMLATAANFSRDVELSAKIPTIVYFEIPTTKQVTPDKTVELIFEDRFSHLTIPSSDPTLNTRYQINLVMPYRQENLPISALGNFPNALYQRGYLYVNVTACIYSNPSYYYIKTEYPCTTSSKCSNYYKVSQDGTITLDAANSFTQCVDDATRHNGAYIKESKNLRLKIGDITGALEDAGVGDPVAFLPFALNSTDLARMAISTAVDRSKVEEFFSKFYLKAYPPVLIYHGGYYNVGGSSDDIHAPLYNFIYRQYYFQGKETNGVVYAIKRIRFRGLYPPKFGEHVYQGDHPRYGPVSFSLRYTPGFTYAWPRHYSLPSTGYLFSGFGDDYIDPDRKRPSYPAYKDAQCGHATLYFEGFGGASWNGHGPGEFIYQTLLPRRFFDVCRNNRGGNTDETAFWFAQRDLPSSIQAPFDAYRGQPARFFVLDASTIAAGSNGLDVSDNRFDQGWAKWERGNGGWASDWAFFAGYALDFEITYAGYMVSSYDTNAIIRNLSIAYVSKKAALMDAGVISIGILNARELVRTPTTAETFENSTEMIVYSHALDPKFIRLEEDDIRSLPRCEDLAPVVCRGNYVSGKTFEQYYPEITPSNITAIAGLTYSGHECYIEQTINDNQRGISPKSTTTIYYTYNFSDQVFSGPWPISYPVKEGVSCNGIATTTCERSISTEITAFNVSTSIRQIHCEPSSAP